MPIDMKKKQSTTWSVIQNLEGSNQLTWVLIIVSKRREAKGHKTRQDGSSVVCFAWPRYDMRLTKKYIS
jgi:hypothetical protein